MRGKKWVMVTMVLGCGHPSPVQPAPDLAPVAVSFPTSDSGVVHANSYGSGPHAVVLGSNGCLKKEGWDAQARELAAAGFPALAIDFRTRREDSRGDEPFYLDILAAVRFLHRTGASRVSVIGASCAGDAAARASVESRPGEIDRLILLAFGGIEEPERMQGRKLFVVARGDSDGVGPRLSRIQAQYERAPGPKRLLVLEGSAHGQRIFGTPEGAGLMREILNFLK